MKELLSPGWSWYVAILTVVSLLVCLWVLRSNSVKKEHGGDPKSIAFCYKIGLDYVSCSAYRVPVARLAAAHAALRHRASS